MANVIYNGYKGKIGTINWADNSGVTIRAMLVTNSYVVDIDAHLNKSDIDALSVEVSGTGYVANGELIEGRVINIDNTTDDAKFNATDVSWASSTITAHGAVVYFDTTNPNTSTLIAYIDFGADKISTDGDFVLQWSGDGVYKIA